MAAASPVELIRDAVIAGGLALALTGVYGYELIRSYMGSQNPDGENQIKVVETPSQGSGEQVAPLRIAVTPHEYDDLGKLLDGLGQGFKHTDIQLDDLRKIEELKKYDVLFLTCGTVPEHWLEGEERPGLRPGTVTKSPREDVVMEMREGLRAFVEGGGTIYASDIRFQLLNIAFSEFVDGALVKQGQAGTVTATVEDAGLQKLLGQQLELKFDQDGWYPAAFQAPQMTVYLSGTYTTADGETVVAPLLVKFPYQEGTIIFTSFHNEKQNSEAEEKLLKYLVFAAVLAKTEASVDRQLLAGGFSPANRSLLSTSAESPSVTQKYSCTEPGALQFVLGFANQGAKLTLTVKDPSGKVVEKKTGESTFSIDVPRATTGEWEYTITADQVPYPNFPFTMTVARK